MEKAPSPWQPRSTGSVSLCLGYLETHWAPPAALLPKGAGSSPSLSVAAWAQVSRATAVSREGPRQETLQLPPEA